MKLNEYRLNSLEEPTDEMLHELMMQVAERVRENKKRSDAELQRRFAELEKRVAENRKLQAQNL